MVITVEVANFAIMKTLVDQGSSVDILYWKIFKKLGIAEEVVIPMAEKIMGFSSEQVDTRRYIDLYTKFGEGAHRYRTVKI